VASWDRLELSPGRSGFDPLRQRHRSLEKSSLLAEATNFSSLSDEVNLFVL
jgi:hypothetical protein